MTLLNTQIIIENKIRIKLLKLRKNIPNGFMIYLWRMEYKALTDVLVAYNDYGHSKN